jgi:hypothetical protein
MGIIIKGAATDSTVCTTCGGQHLPHLPHFSLAMSGRKQKSIKKFIKNFHAQTNPVKHLTADAGTCCSLSLPLSVDNYQVSFKNTL